MSELYTIALMFRGGQRQVNLVFSSASEAEAAVDRLRLASSDSITISDSFGTTVMCIADGRLEAVVMQDTAHASEGGIEMGLLQARTQARAQKRAQHDPAINMATTRLMPMGGPPVRGQGHD
jgi:hypothetical protein